MTECLTFLSRNSKYLTLCTLLKKSPHRIVSLQISPLWGNVPTRDNPEEYSHKTKIIYSQDNVNTDEYRQFFKLSKNRTDPLIKPLTLRNIFKNNNLFFLFLVHGSKHRVKWRHNFVLFRRVSTSQPYLQLYTFSL